MNEIYKIDNFTDKAGREVSKLTPILGNSSPEFFGKTIIFVEDERFNVSFPFDKEVNTEISAFSVFDEALKKSMIEQSNAHSDLIIPNKEVII